MSKSRTILIAVLGLLSALLAFAPAEAATTATVTGRVVDLAGKPIAGLTVYASEQVSEPWGSYFDQVGTTTTGSDGRYRLSVVPDGTTVSVCAPGAARGVTATDRRFVGRCFGKAVGRGDGDPYAPYSAEDRYLEPERKGTEVTAANGRTTAGIDFALSVPARVRGVLRTTAGQPVVGATVTVHGTTRCADFCAEVAASGQTDQQGRYDVAVVDPVSSPDTYCVQVGEAPLRHGRVEEGAYTCTLSLRTGQVVDEPATVVPGGSVTQVHTPYWVGTAKVGWTISARPGTWKPGDPTLSYVWLDGRRQLGTGPTYVVRPAEIGHRITLRTTASAPGYTPAVVDFTRPETTVKGDIYTGRAPSITGTPKVGRTLRASASTPAPTAAITYRWLREGVAIAGATRASYVPTAADRGKRIAVAVTYTKTGYHTLTRTSPRTAAVK